MQTQPEFHSYRGHVGAEYARQEEVGRLGSA